ncbi:MAG TPA: hypothetical protein VHX65_11285 [Pirellulales bacterium]|nr:hypothetical protein [Pirellulales bacterium]
MKLRSRAMRTTIIAIPTSPTSFFLEPFSAAIFVLGMTLTSYRFAASLNAVSEQRTLPRCEAAR